MRKLHHKNFMLKLKECGINPEDVYLHSTGYMNGVYDCADKVLKYIPSGKVIEYGCGTGFMTDYLALRGLDSYGYDIKNHEENLEVFKKDSNIQNNLWKKIRGKFSNEIPDQKFDAVILNASYEHFDDRAFEIKNINNILKDDGYVLIFRCPQPKSFSEHLTKSHKNLLSIETVIEEFQGFKLIEWWYSDFMVWSMPFQYLYNYLFPITKFIDTLFLNTPFKHYSHNINAVLKFEKSHSKIHS